MLNESPRLFDKLSAHLFIDWASITWAEHVINNLTDL